MARLVDAREAEIAVLAYLAVLCAIYNHGFVTRGTELITMRVFHC